MCVFVILAGLAITNQGGPSEADLKAKFLKEAPLAWQDYTSRISEHIAVKVEIIQKTFGNISTQTHPEPKLHNFAMLSSKKLNLLETYKPIGFNSVICTNLTESFMIDRPSLDVSYVLKSLSKPALDMGVAWQFASAYSFMAPVSIGGIPFTEIFTREKLRITSVRRDFAGGRPLVTVEFNNQPDERLPVTQGWFRFDPANGWTLHDAETLNINGAKYRAEMVYGDSVGGLPSLKETNHYIYGTKNPDGGTHQVGTFSQWDRSPISSDRFSMDYYGLPKITLTPVAIERSKDYLWWVVAGLLCGVAAIGLRLARRKLAN